MARRTSWAAALPLFLVAACASKPQPVAVTPAPAPLPTLAQSDLTFAQNTAASDLFEIQASQVAIEKSHSKAIKAYAQQVVDAHTQSGQQLKQILQAQNANPPAATLSSEQQAMLDKLKAAPRHRFDHLYLQDVVQAHQAALSTLQEEATSSQDEAIKAYAQQTTSVVQQHLDQAKQLQGPAHAPMHGHHHHHRATAPQ